jgi:hypothetical protein
MTKASTQRPAKLPPDAELLSIPEASKQLGKGYSRRSIFRRISSGEWIEGVHWIDDRSQNSARRIVKINLTAVNELRATPAAFR